MDIIIPSMDDTTIRSLSEGVPAVRLLMAQNEEAAVSLAASAEAIYSFNSRKLFESAPRLRWVQAGSAGVESYPMELFRARGIMLTNAKEIYGIQLADHAMALVLAFSRQLPFLFRAQAEERWEPREHFAPGELQGQVLLVLGLGGTGLQVARRAHAFGMTVIATKRQPEGPRPPFVDEVHPASAMLDLLPRADWVVVCLPLTSETRGALGARELRAMKQTACLINVTRGGIVQPDALLEALDNGRIAGAGLDVTDPEPLPRGHPLWRKENVIITPHSSGHSPAASARLLALLRENIRRFAEGRELRNLVDLDRQY